MQFLLAVLFFLQIKQLSECVPESAPLTSSSQVKLLSPCLFQVRAQSDFTKKETEVFLQYVQDYRLERQLTALYNRLMGVSALTDQPTLLEEVILSRKPKRWELREFCVKVCEGAGHRVGGGEILADLPSGVLRA